MPNPDHVRALYVSQRGDDRASRVTLAPPYGAASWDLTGHDFSAEPGSLTAITLLNLTHPVSLDGCRFPPGFSIRDCAFTELSVKHCLFGGNTELAKVNATKINCTDSWFWDFLHFDEVKVQHLILDGVYLFGGAYISAVAPWGLSYLQFDGARSSGRLGIRADMGRMTAKGAVVAWVGLYDGNPGSISFDSCKFDNQVEAYSWSDKVVRIHDLSLTECDCGVVRFDDVALGAVRLIDCVVRAAARFATTTVADAPIGTFTSFKSTFLHDVTFENRKFGGETSFRSTKFSAAPKFHGASLHQDTDFWGADFSRTTSGSDAERAFRTLKLAMSNHQAHEEELLFFSLEMKARTAYAPAHSRWLYQLYGAFSLYGRSVLRPFLSLVALALVGVGASALVLDWQIIADCFRKVCTVDVERLSQFVSLSLYQSVPIVAILREITPLRDMLAQANPVTRILYVSLACVQGVLSVILLFLVGLGLRNRFRLH